MICSDLILSIQNGEYDERLVSLYGKTSLTKEKERVCRAIREFSKLYGDVDARVFSTTGRSEISGNHTDHNHGCVLAASVDLDIIAVACKTDDNIIRVKSEGFDEDVCPLGSGDFKKYSSAAIIYGVCDGFEKSGAKIGGFRAYTTSSVLKGSGLSSSAAFEDMTGFILSELYNEGKVDNVKIAKISQYAENKFFGKPCGLMDQVACAVGGFVFIDFGKEEPLITPIKFDLAGAGYDLCIVNTGGNHADLNEDYASVPSEMKAVAACFGKETLRGIKREELLSESAQLRQKLGDRPLLRAFHFINENERVVKQRDALMNGDFDTFLSLVKESGDSSFRFLQNVYTNKNPNEQGLSLAICISENILGDNGVCRVHGGGFAGTVQAFVKRGFTDEYKTQIEKVFGKGSCSVLSVRAEGTAVII
ncbi:MAG: galactokinase [Clostridia bacterium]|nr:galactokinase [Clostridia bacterium]